MMVHLTKVIQPTAYRRPPTGKCPHKADLSSTGGTRITIIFETFGNVNQIRVSYGGVHWTRHDGPLNEGDPTNCLSTSTYWKVPLESRFVFHWKH
uniref:CUB domain-containing protein n=1 Tax=Steinernema glaseri TaxID=37863 RepID=A0A1I7XXJ0_9BILA